MKQEYMQKIVATLADAHRKGTGLPQDAKSLAAIIKQEAEEDSAQPEYGFLAAGKRDYVGDAAKAIGKVLQDQKNVQEIL